MVCHETPTQELLLAQKSAKPVSVALRTWCSALAWLAVTAGAAAVQIADSPLALRDAIMSDVSHVVITEHLDLRQERPIFLDEALLVPSIVLESIQGNCSAPSEAEMSPALLDFTGKQCLLVTQHPLLLLEATHDVWLSNLYIRLQQTPLETDPLSANPDGEQLSDRTAAGPAAAPVAALAPTPVEGPLSGRDDTSTLLILAEGSDSTLWMTDCTLQGDALPRGRALMIGGTHASVLLQDTVISNFVESSCPAICAYGVTSLRGVTLRRNAVLGPRTGVISSFEGAPLRLEMVAFEGHEPEVVEIWARQGTRVVSDNATQRVWTGAGEGNRVLGLNEAPEGLFRSSEDAELLEIQQNAPQLAPPSPERQHYVTGYVVLFVGGLLVLYLTGHCCVLLVFNCSARQREHRIRSFRSQRKSYKQLPHSASGSRMPLTDAHIRALHQLDGISMATSSPGNSPQQDPAPSEGEPNPPAEERPIVEDHASQLRHLPDAMDWAAPLSSRCVSTVQIGYSIRASEPTPRPNLPAQSPASTPSASSPANGSPAGTPSHSSPRRANFRMQEQRGLSSIAQGPSEPVAHSNEVPSLPLRSGGALNVQCGQAIHRGESMPVQGQETHCNAGSDTAPQLLSPLGPFSFHEMPVSQPTSRLPPKKVRPGQAAPNQLPPSPAPAGGQEGAFSSQPDPQHSPSGVSALPAHWATNVTTLAPQDRTLLGYPQSTQHQTLTSPRRTESSASSQSQAGKAKQAKPLLGFLSPQRSTPGAAQLQTTFSGRFLPRFALGGKLPPRPELPPSQSTASVLRPGNPGTLDDHNASRGAQAQGASNSHDSWDDFPSNQTLFPRVSMSSMQDPHTTDEGGYAGLLPTLFGRRRGEHVRKPSTQPFTFSGSVQSKGTSQGILANDNMPAARLPMRVHVHMPGPSTDVPSSALVTELDRMVELKQFLLGKYRLLGPSQRRRGAHGVVQFATVRAGNVFDEVAIKFFFKADSFTTERRMYETSELRRLLPECWELCDNSTGQVIGPSGYTFPPFIVCERGQSLAEFARTAQHERITVIHALCTIAEKLKDLHEAGLVHRDLKPGNILRMPKLHSWALIDLASTAKTGSKAALSFSLAYAPPEVMRVFGQRQWHMQVHTSIDIWAIGIIALELLTQRSMVPSGSQQAWKAALLGKDPLPWECNNAESQALLGKLGNLKPSILQCLNRDPSKRPSAKKLWKTWLSMFEGAAFMNTGGSSALSASGMMDRRASGTV